MERYMIEKNHHTDQNNCGNEKKRLANNRGADGGS